MTRGPKRHGNPSRKGTLAIIGTLLLLSAGVRLATEAGQVVASEGNVLYTFAIIFHQKLFYLAATTDGFFV